MSFATAIVTELTDAARELGAIEAETDASDHMPQGDAYSRVLRAELAIVQRITEMENEGAHLRRLLKAQRAMETR